MIINLDTILRDTLEQLRELSKVIEDLVNIYPDIFDDPAMKERLETFRQAYREAVSRLENPVLSIATIGTTSSGKSTIINALIGRKIAPMEAGEMSGGVLTLRHSNEHKLVIEETEGAAWQTGNFSELSDESLYERIRDGVMFPYHTARKDKSIIAPRVTAFVPILPASSSRLLGLPPGVGVELIDLPGLKSIQDRDNLKVIQERVCKAFSLVALDYLQVDDQHRKRLLEELKTVVQYLQGRTDSMIFIINRVDQRGNEDMPIEQRIHQLQEEIQNVLSLKKLPDILPFNARLLYYAQCAWGSVTLAQQSPVDKATRLKFLKAMFKDCANSITDHIGNRQELRRWFRNVEDQVWAEQHVDDITMKQLMQHALDWSGGSKLWVRLRTRVEESFNELVLLPALIGVFDSYASLAEAIDTVASIRKIQKKEEIEAQQERIAESRRRLPKLVENIREKFCADIKNDIQLLKENNPKAQSLLAQKAQEAGRQGFQSLFQAVDDVEGDLVQFLIAPVRDALKKNHGVFELAENLEKVVDKVLAKNLAEGYDLATRKLANFPSPSQGYRFKQVRADNKQGVIELDEAERAVRQLYHAMREALSVRSEFRLQTQATTIEDALEGLVKEQASKLYDICSQELPSLNLEQAIMATFNKKVAVNPPNLPEKFFELSTAVQRNTVAQSEKIGTKQEIEEYKTGWWIFKSKKQRTVTRDVMGTVEYCNLSLPDADTMARQWSEGITNAKQRLWDVLYDWIIARLNWTIGIFDQSVNEVIDLAERTLRKQLRIVEEDLANEMRRWNAIEAQQALARELTHRLKQQFRKSNIS